MDLFEKKNIKPMLIAEEKEPFDDINYIYELKLDGIRCIAYIDKNCVDLRNKRNDKLLFRYPELSEINKQIKCEKVILDGELFVMKDGKTDFYEMQRRSLMSDKFKIELASKKLPITFTAFDILYKDNQQLTDLTLLERKQILQQCISENERISISRYIEKEGIKLFELTTKNELEGIVAKKKDSKYYFDKRTKDWIKIKNYEEEDFIIMGYSKDSIILGQYNNQNLEYKGKVALGITKEEWNIIKSQKEIERNSEDVFVKPNLVCSVKYMKNSKGLRQAIFKGIRQDRDAYENMSDK